MGAKAVSEPGLQCAFVHTVGIWSDCHVEIQMYFQQCFQGRELVAVSEHCGARPDTYFRFRFGKVSRHPRSF